ncbi:MAG: hypothetical protein J6B81_05755 [Spirochaetaceae bacterium]|nr:hypothetical protein [Spirochaetaceae bacterium]
MQRKFYIILVFLLIATTLVTGCKAKMPSEDTVWVNEEDVLGSVLVNTMTCYKDGTFKMDSSVSIFGIPISIEAASGTFVGNIEEDGKAVFTVNNISKELLSMVNASEYVQMPESLEVTVQNGSFSIDLGIGKELTFLRQ